MQYELKHNEDTALLFEADKQYKITKINKIYVKDKIPIGLVIKNNITVDDFSEWFNSRGISAKRDGVKYILEKENVQSVRELLFKNNGLGLTDHYWIAEAGSSLKWKDINYFENDYGFGKIGEDIYLGKTETRFEKGKSPHSSASGMLPKKWIIKDGTRYLLKGE